MTARALLISLTICALFALLIPWNDGYYQNTPIIGNHFPIGAVLVLTILVLFVNPVLRLLWPQSVLKPGELLSIWCVMVAALSISGSSLLRYFYTTIAGLPYYLSGAPAVREKVLPYVPARMFPSTDGASAVIVGFNVGGGVSFSLCAARLAAQKLRNSLALTLDMP